MSVLEFLHTAGKIEERVEQLAEDHIQKSQHHRRDAEPDDRAARHLFPHFAQLIARLADNDNAAAALLAEHDAHLTRTDPRANEVGEPLRRAIGMHEDVALGALVGRDLNEFAMRVADEMRAWRTYFSCSGITSKSPVIPSAAERLTTSLTSCWASSIDEMTSTSTRLRASSTASRMDIRTAPMLMTEMEIISCHRTGRSFHQLRCMSLKSVALWRPIIAAKQV